MHQPQAASCAPPPRACRMTTVALGVSATELHSSHAGTPVPSAITETRAWPLIMAPPPPLQSLSRAVASREPGAAKHQQPGAQLGALLEREPRAGPSQEGGDLRRRQLRRLV